MAILPQDYFIPDFPGQVWDGLSGSPKRYHPLQFEAPDGYDYAKISAELIATQQFLLDAVSNISVPSEVGIPAFAFVQLDNNGNAILASNLQGTLLGLTREPIPAGGSGLVTIQGIVLNPAFSLIRLRPYFLHPGGQMSLTPPVFGHIIRLGVAISSTQLLVEIYHVVNLGD